jgi:hypothetical protein
VLNAVGDGPWRWRCEGARMWVSQYLEKRVNAEREVEVGRRRGSVLKAEDLTGSCSSLGVESPRALSSRRGLCLTHKVQ